MQGEGAKPVVSWRKAHRATEKIPSVMEKGSQGGVKDQMSTGP